MWFRKVSTSYVGFARKHRRKKRKSHIRIRKPRSGLQLGTGVMTANFANAYQAVMLSNQTVIIFHAYTLRFLSSCTGSQMP